MAELGDEDDHEDERGRDRAGAVDDALAVQLSGVLAADRLEQPRPMPDHPRLAQREREEDAEDVELDQPGDVGVEGDDQKRRDQREENDPVREHEAVAAVGELVREVVVAPEQGGEHREAVEGGVRGEDQDRRRERLQQVERRGVAERGEPDLADRRPLLLAGGQPDQVRRILGHVDVRGDRERGDPGEHRDRERAHDHERRRRIPALRLLEGGNPVRDRLDPGERGAAGGERAQDQEDDQDAAGVGDVAKLIAGALRGEAVAEQDLGGADGEHREARRRRSRRWEGRRPALTP